MRIRLFQRRTVLFPTTLGWICLFVASVSAFLFWIFNGEAFLCTTKRLPAEVLVVEGWIGPEGVRAASVEFKQGGYQWVVTTSGLSDIRWSENQWSFAKEAAKQLMRAGVMREKVLIAVPSNTENQRTYESAKAVFRTLQESSIDAKAINIFTLGAHARRSRLIFSKIFRPKTEIGVISWLPDTYQSIRWWHSSARAEDFLKESVGYLYEAAFNSGRGFNSTPFKQSASKP
jgi:hypothetical protein